MNSLETNNLAEKTLQIDIISHLCSRFMLTRMFCLLNFAVFVVEMYKHNCLAKEHTYKVTWSMVAEDKFVVWTFQITNK